MSQLIVLNYANPSIYCARPYPYECVNCFALRAEFIEVMIEQNYFIKSRICPFNLSYCALDHNAWKRADNCRGPGLLDHFMIECTEDYQEQDYLGIYAVTWKVKPYHTMTANVACLSVSTGCHSPLCHSCHISKSVLASTLPDASF